MIKSNKCRLFSYSSCGRKCLTVGAGRVGVCDRCVRVQCDDTLPVFIMGWCPGMLHSVGETNQAPIVSSSLITALWQGAPLSQQAAGSSASAVSKY